MENRAFDDLKQFRKTYRNSLISLTGILGIEQNHPELQRRQFTDPFVKELTNIIVDKISAEQNNHQSIDNLIRSCTQVINSSYLLHSVANEFIEDIEKQQNIELCYEDSKKESERKHLWKLWYQKVIRWVLGSIVAVILYSLLVSAAEQWRFIKIPIKHTFGFQNTKGSLISEKSCPINNINESTYKTKSSTSEKSTTDEAKDLNKAGRNTSSKTTQNNSLKNQSISDNKTDSGNSILGKN